MPRFSFETFIAQEPIQRTLRDILNHPYNKSLADSTLSRALYHAYLTADELYLKGYKQVLRKISDSSSDETIISRLLEDTIQFELDMQARKYHAHSEYNPLFQPISSKTNEVVNTYLHHLGESSQRNFPLAIAAILPCIWSYYKLGENINLPPAQLNIHTYQAWIMPYKSTYYQNFTAQMITYFEQVCETLSSEELNDLTEVFHRSLKFELDLYEAVHPTPIEKLSSEQTHNFNIA